MDTIVLMLVYNEEKTIGTAIESIINQNLDLYSKAEIVIVDDASTDDTIGKAYDALLKSSLDFKIIFNDKNLGVIKSAQKAFDAIKSRDCLLLRLDGDDELPQNALRSLIKNYKEGTFVTGSYLEKSESLMETIRPKTVFSALASGVLMHMNDIVKAGGLAKDDVGIFIEYDLYARLIHNKCKPTIIDNTVYIYNRHDGSITSDKSKVNDSMSKLNAKWGDKITSLIRDY